MPDAATTRDAKAQSIQAPSIKAQLKQKVIAENKCFIVDKLQVVNGLQSYVETTFLDVVCSYFLIFNINSKYLTYQIKINKIKPSCFRMQLYEPQKFCEKVK